MDPLHLELMCLTGLANKFQPLEMELNIFSTCCLTSQECVTFFNKVSTKPRLHLFSKVQCVLEKLVPNPFPCISENIPLIYLYKTDHNEPCQLQTCPYKTVCLIPSPNEPMTMTN